jgi:dynein heavy chain, axonemal
VSASLEDYNAMSKVRMDLVLFTNFLQHICRVVRVVKLPLGNSLCVGVGGSGRKSVTQLAAFICGCNLFQIEISKTYGMNEWHDDMKKLLMGSGMLDKKYVFLFPDTHIAKEAFLEDVSSILNTGEIPNLYTNEDKMEIIEKCAKNAQAAGKTAPNEIFQWYVQNCRKNLHIVLAMSPIGEQFRRRLRMFPSLVNCCTINMFNEWPKDALQAVAIQFLKKEDMPEQVLSGVVKTMVSMQTSVFDLTEKFESELRRHNYVTPTSYLELINSFLQMLKQQRQVVKQAQWR